MVKNTYIPDARDIVWVDCPSGSGHEQHGRRPALVLTIKEYNSTTGLMMATPITSKVKGYPFEIALPDGILDKKSVLLVHQTTTMDFKARNAEFCTSVKMDVLQDVKDMLAAILEID